MKKIIFIFAAVLFCMSFASATFSYRDYTQKWNLCTALNYTTIQCDAWWENASDYNSVATNISVNLSSYYTKADVDSIFQKFIQSWNSNWTTTLNGSNLTILYNTNLSNFSGYYTKTEIDNQTMVLRNSLMDRYDAQLGNSSGGSYNNLYTGNVAAGSSFNPPPWAIILVFVAVVAGLFIWQNRGKMKARQLAPLAQQMNQSNSNAEQLAAIGDAVKKLSNKQQNQQKMQDQNQQQNQQGQQNQPGK